MIDLSLTACTAPSIRRRSAPIDLAIRDYVPVGVRSGWLFLSALEPLLGDRDTAAFPDEPLADLVADYPGLRSIIDRPMETLWQYDPTARCYAQRVYTLPAAIARDDVDRLLRRIFRKP